MSESPVAKRHGETIDLGRCAIGQNLNLLVLRGFAPLDVLAEVSAPDVYDQMQNPTGTQRDLKAKHAQECYNYAIGSLAVAPEDEPRCFPEIILNARDAAVLELYDVSDEGTVYELNSCSDTEELETDIVGLRVLTSQLEYPKGEENPQISRVDGNHRLHQTDVVLEESWKSENGDLDQDFPTVPFTLLLGLDHLQEARLFRDINGEHQGMETAHLDTIMYKILDHTKMKADPKLRPLWLAHKLTEEGRAFEGMVFFGASKTGVKKELGEVPPVKINALKSTIAAQLKAAPTVTANLSENPEALLELLDRFWKAVRETYPEAWQNRKEYVLLQAIGLGAFAKLGGIVLERATDAGAVKYEDIKSHLAPAALVSLKRGDYPGIAGAGGAQFIADILIKAADADKVKAQKVIDMLGGEQAEAASPLDE